MALDTDYLDRLIEQTSGASAFIPPFCLNCGYNLMGATTPQCSECGHVFDRAAWRRQAMVIRQQLQELEEAGEWAKYGLIAAVIGAACTLLAVLAGVGFIGGMFRLGAVLSALIGASLALGLLRVKRLPEWAFPLLADPPEYTKTGIALALSVASLLAAILV